MTDAKVLGPTYSEIQPGMQSTYTSLRGCLTLKSMTALKELSLTMNKDQKRMHEKNKTTNESTVLVQ